MPTYKNYAIIADPRRVVNFNAEINHYMTRSLVGEDVSITNVFPTRIVTKSAQDNLLSIPNIGFYELTKAEATTLASTASIKSVVRHFSDEETIVTFNGAPTSSVSESFNSFFKGSGSFLDFYSLTHFRDPIGLDYTGSITGSRLAESAIFFSQSQEVFYFNGGENIFLDSASYSQNFLERFVQASMSYDNSVTASSNFPDGEDFIGLALDGGLTPYYLENKQASSNVNGTASLFGGGGLGYYNIVPTINKRWRRSEFGDNNVSIYTDDWPGSIYDSTGQMVNWGLYAHSTPKEDFDWRIMFQLDTDPTSKDSHGNFPLKSTSVPYNVTATGKNVDLIIIDQGVNDQHPEFKYYDPDLLNGIGGWVSRVEKTNWPDFCPEILNNPISMGAYSSSLTFRSQYYTNMMFEHGTSVASNAAGRTQGWAKEARIHDLKIFGNPRLTVPQAFQCVKNFHVSKSINPETGFKDPTVVNMSFGYYNEPINISQWYNSDGELFNWTEPTKIRKVYYKGVDLYPNYTGSIDDNGDYHWNLMPGPNEGARFMISESFQTSYYLSSTRKAFRMRTQGIQEVVDELIQQCVDEGVILVSSAGNEGRLIVKTGSKYEGVDYDHRGLWDSYIIKDESPFDTGSTSGYTYYLNRASTPASNEGVITVGALAPNICIDKGTDLLTSSLLTSGSHAYDMFGERAGCPYVFGCGNSGTFIRDGFRNIPEFEHSDMHQVKGTSTRSPKKGTGVGDTFPGWENLNTSSYFPPVFFSNIGNGVDIWAAGHDVGVARADLDQIISEVTGFGFRPTKHVSSSLAHFQTPIQPDFYFLGNPAYPDYLDLYPEPSPPSLITQQHYRVQSGTSFSSPNVAGVVCLFMELNPGATPKQVKKFLIEQGQKAMPVWNDNPSQNFADFTGSMKSEYALAAGNYGGGQISPVASSNSMAPSQNRDIAICGAEPVMLYWPFSNPKTQFNNINLTKS
jgi:hypothetical protein